MVHTGQYIKSEDFMKAKTHVFKGLFDPQLRHARRNQAGRVASKKHFHFFLKVSYLFFRMDFHLSQRRKRLSFILPTLLR